MAPSLTDTLCTRCGLCCDGSLFADVELAGGMETARLEVMGLVPDDDDAEGSLLSLPCAALRGRRCGIYPHRPACCRTFECRLLRDARRGATSIERARASIAEALTRIGRVKALLGRLGRHDGYLPLGERVAGALAIEPGSNPERNRRRAQLEAEMSAVEGLIRKRFLGGGAKIDRAGRACPELPMRSPR
jgi:hypothetical protein